MSITGNNQVYSYTNQTGCIYVMGNNNTINLKQCQAIINVIGNSNTLNMIQSMVESNVNGNGNNFILIGSAFQIGINGNGNILRNRGNEANGELTYINILYNNGTNNLLDGTSNVGLQANQASNNYGSFYSPQQQRQMSQNQQNFRNNNNGFQSVSRQHCFYPNQGQSSDQINLLNSWWYNPLSNSNSFAYSNNNNGNNVPQRGHYSFSSVPTFSFHQSSTYSFNGRQPQQQSSSSSQNKGLSQSEISLLPVIQYEGVQQECSICLEEIKKGNKVVYLFCFHNFHEECGVSWFRRSATCPLCQLNIRRQIRENE